MKFPCTNMKSDYFIVFIIKNYGGTKMSDKGQRKPGQQQRIEKKERERKEREPDQR
jgi:hypothetical protein